MSEKTFKRSIVTYQDSDINTASSFAAITTTETKYSINHPRWRIVQNFVTIWLDLNTDQSRDDCKNALTQLDSVVHDINIFTNLDDCVDFLTEIDDEKVFMIIAGTVSQEIVSLIHNIPQLNAIYIFCFNKSIHEQWIQEWPKVKGLHTLIVPLCEDLQEAVKQCDQDSMPVSFVKIDNGVVNRHLNQIEPSFMYTQIFKEILLEMEYNEQSVKDLVLYCREKYTDNNRELNIIAEFADVYQPKLSIWWYTRECFIYHMLNRALRTMEADTIINMGFFIRDLHRQIVDAYEEQRNSYYGESFIVYRGQGLSTSDFEKLMKTKGGLMSFNNCLPTSKNQQITSRFAERAMLRNDE